MVVKNNTSDLTERLREHLTRTLVPGTHVTETELAEHFQVCRASIREALKALESEGLIDRCRRLGISLHHFTLRDISELYDLRAVLEGFACGRACQVVSLDQLNELQSLAEEYNGLVPQATDAAGSQRASACDARFHALLIEIAGNHHLHELLDNISLMRKSFMLYAAGFRRNRSSASTPFSHTEIVKALRSADAALAERLMREHVLWAKRHLLEELAMLPNT